MIHNIIFMRDDEIHTHTYARAKCVSLIYAHTHTDM